MSKFNRFCAKAQDALRRAGDKAEEMLEDASKAVKTKALEIRIDEQYEKLGRLVYRDLHTEENLEEEKLKIIAAIDALFDELAVRSAEAENAAPDEGGTEKNITDAEAE